MTQSEPAPGSHAHRALVHTNLAALHARLADGDTLTEDERADLLKEVSHCQRGLDDLPHP